MWVRFEVVVEGWKGGGGVGVECFIHILKEIYRLDLQRAKGQVIKLGDYLTDLSFYLSLNLFFFYCYSSTVVSIFPSTTHSLPSHPIPTFHPQSYPPLALSMCPLYVFLDDTSPIFPLSLIHI